MRPWRKKEEENEFADWDCGEESKKEKHPELKRIIAAFFLFCVVYGFERSETFIGEIIDTGVKKIVTEHTDFSALNSRMQSYLPEDWSGKVLANVQNVLARPASPLLYLSAPSNGEIASRFGKQTEDRTKREFVQTGIEYKNDFGDFIEAVGLGKVKKVGMDDKLGWFIVVAHGQNLESVYGYLGDVLVKEGERVGRGQKIARSGERPRDKEPLFYFELRENGVAIDPAERIKGDFTAQGGL